MHSHLPRLLAIATASLTLVLPAIAQIEGKWLGTAGHPDNSTVFGLEIEHRPGHPLSARVTLEQMSYFGAQLPEFKELGDRRYQIPALGVDLTLEGDNLVGTMAGGGAPVVLRRSESLPAEPPVPANLPSGPGPRWQTKLGSAIYAPVATRDGIAYVGTIGGVFQALKVADGSFAWTFNAGRPVFGEALATDEAVYFACDNGFLFKLARDTGKEVWRYDLGDARVERLLPHPQVYDYDYQAPRPLLVDRTLYVGSGDDGFHAVNAADGKRLWRIATKGKVRTDAAVVGANVVFTTSGGQVVMAERTTGRVVWKKEYQAPVTSSPVAAGDRLIIGGRDSQLQALNIANGEQLWRVGFWGSWVEATPVLVDDKIYLGSSDLRRVGCHDPANGRIVWRTDVFGWTWGRPVVTARHVYAATSGVKPYDIRHVAGLCALDRATGRLLWRWPLAEPAGAFHWGFAAGPVRSGDNLLVGGLDGTLYAFPIDP
jgi:outer membrane protein assembly factor BamB